MMSESISTSWIWMDGDLVPWNEGKVHLLTHSLHYGLGVFEGTRAYEQKDGSTAVFRLHDHLRRLEQSARIVRLDLPFDHGEMQKATLDLLEANGHKSCYFRHLIFVGDGSMGVDPGDNPIRLAIASWKWGAYLGEEGLRKGVRLLVSTHARLSFGSMFHRAKATGNYVTGVLAKREAVLRGYDDCVMLDANGYVAESSGANLFIVRDGVLKTAPPPAILPGITRDTVMWLAEQRGWKVLQMPFARDEMYSADEVFLSGTAAEVTPVREVDDRPIGDGVPGPVALELQQAYLDMVSDGSLCPEGWSTPARAPELVEA
jgi:branched-chain amino acid aminotransferase